MANVIRRQKFPKEVQILGGGFRTSMWMGVLLNGYFSHASELEDDRYVYGISWDITLVPLLLSMAEKLGLSGKKFIEALSVGLEVHVRTCSYSADHLGLYLIPGAAGPAIGAAKALGLGKKETAAAFGLGMSGVPLSMTSLGTDAHYFESALMSLQGVIAAEMAQEGLSGNPDVATYLTNYLGKDKVDPRKMVEDLGKRWIFREIQIKKYPCCIALHRQIDLVLELKEKHNLSINDVEYIEVRSRRKGDQRCNRPEPKSENDLQFSFQHTLAAAMLDGDVSLGHFTPEAVADPRLTEARSRVKFIPAPDDLSVDSLGDALSDTPAHVVIKTKDGRTFEKQKQYALGHFMDPLTKEQFEELYRKFTRDVLPEKNILESAEAILNLEKIKNVKDVLKMLA